jgi:hypothetical protein
MRTDNDTAGTIILAIIFVAIVLHFTGGEVTDRCPDGYRSVTYVQSGGAEHDVCVRE